MSNNYWSSTTNANNTDNAWNLNFNNGNQNNNNKTNNNYVRCVRAGEYKKGFICLVLQISIGLTSLVEKTKETP
ncbi:MAG: DUF1566 domain-containing protein [Helicobacteraceae bacterium]|nr:DUF1566 domain-containing protein [Candidatus Sulfurimonas ponti]